MESWFDLGIPMSLIVMGLIAAVSLGAVLLLIVSRVMKGKSEPAPLVTKLGWSAFSIICFGIAAGIYVLSFNPKPAKPPKAVSIIEAASLYSETKFTKEGTQPRGLDYHLYSHQGALFLDLWSLRIVFPGRGTASWSQKTWQAIDQEPGKKTIPFGDSVVTIDWTGNFSGPEGESLGTLVVSIDEVVVTVEKGIAEIDGHQIPTTGPVQVVFLDQFGGVEEIQQQEGDGKARIIRVRADNVAPQ
ncbi:MAG TPA: hypothetical protein EYN00_08445 [Planctomycetes bacterium]|nr:hypothetical protein [Planctomycetota bacterium]